MVGFTLITRTSGRPRFFARCRQSVLSQTHPYVFHLIISDDPADHYAKGDFVALVEYKEGRGHNTYFNEVRKYIPDSHPWVIFLDDDDEFTMPDALALIAATIESENDLLLWQVRFPDRLVPGDALGLPPVAGNITGIGFCYHKKHWVNWSALSFGDFFVIRELYFNLRPQWIDFVFTAMQIGPGHGLKKDLEHGLHFSTS